MEQVELTAKVLATENISVYKKNAQTAYFDIVNRVLVLPNWNNMTADVEGMLTLHEVGHALFTPSRYVELSKEVPQIGSILNVIEDARIERLMKERYPGSRKTFTSAYKELRDTDFFEVKDKNVNTFSFIDRANLYFKLGIFCGVKFTKTEYPFVLRISNAVTFEEVEAIAKDLLEHLKKEKEQLKKQLKELEQGEDEEGESVDLDQDQDGEGNDEVEDKDLMFELIDENNDLDETSGELEKANNPVDEFESKTDSLLQEKLKEAANTDEIVTYNFSEEYPADMIVPFKTILKRCNEYALMLDYEGTLNSYMNKFKQETLQPVNHLVQQFELKKAADIYVRRKQSKTGLIDVNKIASYKVKDDIFKRITVSPEGENHGMIMLLDWSQSMNVNSAIDHSLNQIAQLVLFCNKTSIPFRVYAFASNPMQDNTLVDTLTANYNHFKEFRLYELFSNKMTSKEMNEMISFVSSRILTRCYKLTFTPFTPALLFMRKVIPEFLKQHKVKKLNLVSFTDGGCTSHVFPTYKTCYLHDSVTKKNYLINRNTNRHTFRGEQTVRGSNAVFNMLKDRFGVTVTSFFIKSRNLLETYRYSGMYDADLNNTITLGNDLKKNGFAHYTGYGRDNIYIVDSQILQTREFNIDGITNDMKPASIASVIKKSSKSSIKGKILIEKLSDAFA